MSRMVTFLGRESMNSTASATSFASMRLPAASASSSFAFGQSLMQRGYDRPGGDLADPDPVLDDLAPERMDERLTANFDAV